MDETPVFFGMVPNKFFSRKPSKPVPVGTPGCEKKHVTLVLTIATCGDIRTPVIIYPGKTDHSIEDHTVPDNLCIITQEKAWMDELLMMLWYDKIWLTYVRRRVKEIGFYMSLMVMNAFKVYFIDEQDVHLKYSP